MSNSLLLIHGLCTIWTTEDLINFLRLNYWVSTYHYPGNKACKLCTLSPIEHFTSKKSQQEFSWQDIARLSELQPRYKSHKFSARLQIIIEPSFCSQVDIPWDGCWEWDACICEVFDLKEALYIHNSLESKDCACNKVVWVEDLILPNSYSPGIIFKYGIILLWYILSIFEFACS